MTDHDLLWRAARRVADDPFFLASALLAFAAAEGLDEDGLALHLGCGTDQLPALLLCRRPRGEAQMFRAGVHRIADRFGLDPAHLGRIIRTADALAAFSGAAMDGPGGMLAAARDRPAPEQPRAAPPAVESPDSTPGTRRPGVGDE